VHWSHFILAFKSPQETKDGLFVDRVLSVGDRIPLNTGNSIEILHFWDDELNRIHPFYKGNVYHVYLLSLHHATSLIFDAYSFENVIASTTPRIPKHVLNFSRLYKNEVPLIHSNTSNFFDQ
jgi:hypothetical protein